MIREKDKLVMEIMCLAYAVQRNTDYGIFIDYSGHVDSLSIKICPTKEDYRTEIASTDFYIDKYENEGDGLGWLKTKRDHLKQILEDGEIDFCDMDKEIIETVEHHF